MGSRALLFLLQDFKYVLIRFLALSANSGNCLVQESMIAWIFSFGCLLMGTILSRFSSTNNLTNICNKNLFWKIQKDDIFHVIIIIFNKLVIKLTLNAFSLSGSWVCVSILSSLSSSSSSSSSLLPLELVSSCADPVSAFTGLWNKEKQFYTTTSLCLLQ